MSNPLLLAMAAMNAGIAFGYLKAGNIGMTITFTCYAVACVGFVISNLDKGV